MCRVLNKDDVGRMCRVLNKDDVVDRTCSKDLAVGCSVNGPVSLPL